jgi:hypothetical protein
MTKPASITIVCVVLVIGAGAIWFLKTRDEEFPYIYNPANFVSTQEIQRMEQLVRDRGERYIVSINIVSTRQAPQPATAATDRAVVERMI